MPVIKLTDTFIRSLKAETRTDYHDVQVRGLSLRVAPSGTKTWNLLYTRESDSAKQRVKLGRYPAIDLEAARSKALKAMSGAAEGQDPADKKRALKASLTVQQLGELYIEKYAKRQKKTWEQDERLLKAEVYPQIGRMKSSAVRRRDILNIVEAKAEAGFGAQSTNILAVVRKMFNWAVDGDYIEASPAAGIKPRAKPVKRDRVLSGKEIKAIWNALPGAALSDQIKDIIRLLFLTGQRSGEVAGMMRSELDLEAALWTIPKTRTKNKLTHVVPLAPAAITIIQAAVDNLDRTRNDAPLFAKIEDPIESNAVAQAARLKLQVADGSWTPHDIRRSVATGMAGIGVMPHIIEATLNHISGFKAGVAGVYNRATYEPEKRDALDRWAKKLSAIIK